MMKLLATLFCLCFLINFVSAEDEVDSKDPKAILSLFNVVTFKNGACKSSSTVSSSAGTFLNGTCFTVNECTQKQGTVSGQCASSFGVCCVFTLQNSGIVSQNLTYLQNPGFPSVYSATSSISYTINPCSNCNAVCEIRLDFLSFALTGPTGSQEVAGGACSTDTMTTTVSGGEKIPVICGLNDGQHMYINVGRDAGNTVVLNFVFNGASTVRTWDICVSYIPCRTDGARPIHGCLQYFTGVSGTFQTFNFQDTKTSHLANQDYSACIRQEVGYCCVQYTPCSTQTNSFNIFDVAANPNVATVDTNCNQDYIGLPGAASTCPLTGGQTIISKFCGQKLSTIQLSTTNTVVCSCSTPFRIDVFTDGLPDDITQSQRGVCLTWQHVPCA